MVFVYISVAQSRLISLSLSPSRTFANVYLGDTDSFQVNHVYKDANTYTVVSAASEVLGECDFSVSVHSGKCSSLV